MTTTNPSGVGGLKGRVADAFDSIPVKGAMAVLVTVGGLAVALSNGGLSKGSCARTPLVHVYRPQRLTVMEKCADVTGTVAAWRHEHDGDYHVAMTIPGDWTNAVNDRSQHDYTVVEFVPLEPRPAKFFVGQRLHMIGTKVLDRQHGGWIELHPVFKYEDVTPAGPGAPPTGGKPLVPLTPTEETR